MNEEQLLAGIRAQVKRALRGKYTELKNTKYPEASFIGLDASVKMDDSLFDTILGNAHWWYRKREQAEIAGTDSALMAQDTSCALEELAAWLEGEASYLAELWRIQRMYVLEKQTT